MHYTSFVNHLINVRNKDIQVGMNSASNATLDHLYKEYARLSDKSEELIKSVFDDFKLFGTIAVFLPALKPILDFIIPTNLKVDSGFVVFMAFISLRAVLYVIGFLVSSKVGYLLYLTHNLQAYEIKIKEELSESPDSEIFNFNLGKEEARFAITYRLPFRAIFMLMSLIADLIPFIILYFYVSSYQYSGQFLRQKLRPAFYRCM